MNDISPEFRLRELGGTLTIVPPPDIDDPGYRSSQDAGTGKKKDAATDHDDVTTATLPLIPINQIPPRPWAYGRFLLFGSAAVIGAVDGGGKGAIAVAMMLSVITGRGLLSEHVWKSGPVAIVTYEDDATEWHRRIAAACIHYGLDYGTVLAQVRFIYRVKGRITFGRHGEHGIEFPDSKGILEQLALFGPVLLIVDPFNHAHSLEDGNSNALVARVAGEMTRIAQEARCAVLVLHHLRKGSNGGADDLMGATSLRATFRSCRILARMTPEEGKAFGMEREAWRCTRIAGSKENYAPPPDKSTWFRLESVKLENGADIYPDGDNVAVATIWSPPAVFGDLDAVALRTIFDAIRTGLPDGEWHAPRRQAAKRWVGHAVVAATDKTPEQAATIIKQWLDDGVLNIEKYASPSRRAEVERVVLDETKATAIVDQIQPPDDADDE